MKPIAIVSVNVTFNDDGTLSGTTNYNDQGADYFLSGTGDTWTGQFNSDFLNCNNPNPCQATGYWRGNFTIPEPMTITIFGIGIAGAVALRRRRKPKLI